MLFRGHHSGGSGQTKATFSGMTALTAVVALLLAIISAAVPHWGYYSPIGAQYYASGKVPKPTFTSFLTSFTVVLAR